METGSNTTMGSGEREPWIFLFLLCGLWSSLLYVGSDISAAMSWPAYSYADQSVSELMALGTPTRPLLVRLFSIYNGLVILFGIGVISDRGRRKLSLRITGFLLMAYGLVGFAGLLFFPMHIRGAEQGQSGLMHIMVTSVTVVLIFAILWFGALAGGRSFRIYSLVTIGVLLLFGGLAAFDAQRLALGLPTPWLGIMERITIYGFLLWIALLAKTLLSKGKNSSDTQPNMLQP